MDGDHGLKDRGPGDIYSCTAEEVNSPNLKSVGGDPHSPTYRGRNGAVLLAMNGALQEWFAKSSPSVRDDERGAVLQAPESHVAASFPPLRSTG